MNFETWPNTRDLYPKVKTTLTNEVRPLNPIHEYVVAFNFLTYGSFPQFSRERPTGNQAVRKMRDNFFDLLVGARFADDSSLQFIAIQFENISGSKAVIGRMDGILAGIDIYGDQVLRRWEDHIAKDPAKYMRRRLRPNKRALNNAFFEEYSEDKGPLYDAQKAMRLLLRDRLTTISNFVEIVGEPPKRQRGTPEQIYMNHVQLGMTDLYGYHPSGVLILDGESFFNGKSLQDKFRENELGRTDLKAYDIDRILRLSGRKLARIQAASASSLGECLTNDIFFHTTGPEIDDVTFNMADIVYNSKVPPVERAAIDFMDAGFSLSMEMIRRGDSWDTIHRRVSIFMEEMNPDARKLMHRFIVNGRLTFPDQVEHVQSKIIRAIAPQHTIARTFNLDPLAGKYIREVLKNIAED